MEFSNRKAQNKNKVVITPENGEAFSAVISRDDNPIVGQEGTLLSAEVFNAFQESINEAVKNATNAVSSSETASESSTKALNKAMSAEVTADAAQIIANEALIKAEDAKSSANEALLHSYEQGSRVYENQELIRTFDADKKLNVEQGINNASKVLITDESGVVIVGDTLPRNIVKNLNCISNPNLLINGDFKINQRGKTSYSTANSYTVDRWKLVSGSVTVTNSGITLNGTITQTLENVPTTPVTASADQSNGEVEVSYSNGVYTLSAENVEIKWAKLEVGEIATAFSPKTTSQELMDCQRYYYNTEGQVITGYVGGGGATIYLGIVLPTVMRIAPTLSFTNIENMRISGNYYGLSFVAIERFSGNTISVLFEGNAPNGTVGSTYVEFEADAEIY